MYQREFECCERREINVGCCDNKWIKAKLINPAQDDWLL